MPTLPDASPLTRARYEYRVWGKQRRARRVLVELADDETVETIDDCYLLVDDTSWNAKVRGNTLKVKQLVAQRKGFEQWSRERFASVADAPTPFDTLLERLGIDIATLDGPAAVHAVVDRDGGRHGIRSILVTKHRRRYQVGSLRAEVTEIDVHGTRERLRTLSIEGDDLDELKALRKRLGVRDEDNVAVHRALDLALEPLGRD